jgi:hypothetical protein
VERAVDECDLPAFDARFEAVCLKHPQALVHQPVEMKRRGRARQLQPGGSVVATYRSGLAYHVVI